MGRHKEFYKPWVMKWVSAKRCKPSEGYVLIILKNETTIRTAYYDKTKGYCFESDLVYLPMSYSNEIWKFFEIKNMPFPTFPVKERDDTYEME